MRLPTPWRTLGRFGVRAGLPTGAAAVGIGLVVAGLTAYGFLTLAARSLGPVRYAPLSGLWFLAFFTGPGLFVPLEQEVARRVAAGRARGEDTAPVIVAARRFGLQCALAMTVVTAAASPLLLRYLFDRQLALLVAFVLVLNGYFVEHFSRGILSGNGLFERYGALLAIEGTVRLVAAVVFGLVGVAMAGPYGLVIGVAPWFASALAVWRRPPTLGSGPPTHAGGLRRSVGLLLAGSILSQLLANAAPLAAKSLAAPGEQELVGRFVAALLVARVPLFLFQAVQAALLPSLAALIGRESRQEFDRSVRRLFLLVLAVGAISTAGSYSAGPWVVRLFFGPEFSLHKWDLASVAAGSGLHAAVVVLGQALIALNRPGHAGVGWGAGVASFFVVVWATSSWPLLSRVEVSFVVAEVVALFAVCLLLWRETQPGKVGTSSTAGHPT